MNGLENWKDRTSQTYKAIKELNEAFDEQREEMEAKIRKVCSANGMVVDYIKGSSDNSVFEVKFIRNTSDEIQLPWRFIAELGMGFSVKRILDKEAKMHLLLVLYPFWDEED